VKNFARRVCIINALLRCNSSCRLVALEASCSAGPLVVEGSNSSFFSGSEFLSGSGVGSRLRIPPATMVWSLVAGSAGGRRAVESEVGGAFSSLIGGVDVGD
jgi:hypothetical protein